MAVGDLFWFDIATRVGFPASSAFSSDDTMSCVLTTTAGVTSTSTGAYTSFTEASTGHTAGGYPASGTTLDTWGDMWKYPGSGKVATFDTTTNPSWTQSSLHSTSVNFAMIVNLTEVGRRPVCAVDLGDVDMTAGDLTITWNASGIATITST